MPNCALLDERNRFLFRTIEHIQGISCFKDMKSHALTHDAGTNKANGRKCFCIHHSILEGLSIRLFTLHTKPN